MRASGMRPEHTMRFFVNLPLSYILDQPEYLQFFVENKLRPELGADIRGLDTPDTAWHHSVAQTLARAGLDCSMHLPFIDLHPGSEDSLVRTATARRLHKAIELAAIYKPRHLVGHARFEADLHAANPAAWIERSLETWTSLASVAEKNDLELPPLYLENTFETKPEPVRDVTAALVSQLDTPVGICFDPGHWFSFARGYEKNDLPHWMKTFAPLLKHLHLHDNDGTNDQHLGLGQGNIPWQQLNTLLTQNNLAPTATLEPHDEQSFHHSTTYLAQHPTLFEGGEEA